jgi:hypothetical protein
MENKPERFSKAQLSNLVALCRLRHAIIPTQRIVSPLKLCEILQAIPRWRGD